MRVRPVPIVALLIAIVCAWPAAHGQPTPQERVLRSGVDMVTVAVTVLDADGRLARGLPRDAFEVFEDGEPQTITQFTHERVPIGLGLLLDVSDSMFGHRIVDARSAVERFLLELLSPADQFFVLAFNHSPHLLSNWTSTADDVKTALTGLKPFGGTAMYDALLYSLPIVAHRARQRAAVVVISDGADTASDAALSEVRTALVRSDAFVYAIAIDSPKPQPINTRVNETALNELTSQSGGVTQIVRDAADLADATARVAEELNNQYVLGYPAPRPPDGRFHSIRISIRRPGHKARARNGYIAVPRATGSR